jgi:hypothetical protein
MSKSHMSGSLVEGFAKKNLKLRFVHRNDVCTHLDFGGET